MWYEVYCSPTFEKEFKELHKYVTEELKSLVGWQSVKRDIYYCISTQIITIKGYFVKIHSIDIL